MIKQFVISGQFLSIDKVRKVLDHDLLNEVHLGDSQYGVQAYVGPVNWAVLFPQADLSDFWRFTQNGKQVSEAEKGGSGAGYALVAPVGVLSLNASKK